MPALPRPRAVRRAGGATRAGNPTGATTALLGPCGRLRRSCVDDLGKPDPRLVSVVARRGDIEGVSPTRGTDTRLRW